MTCADGPRRLAGLCLVVLAIVGAPPPVLAGDWKSTQKAFRDAQRSEDWKARKAAYLELVDHDGAAAVDEVLSALGREDNGSVQLAAVATLAGFRTPEGAAAVAAAARAAKGPRRGLLLLALADQRGTVGTDVVLGLLEGGDPPTLMLASAAAGKREIEAAVPRLLELLAHKDWQVRRAAARALLPMSRHVPDGSRAKLVDALLAATGRERADLIELAKKVYGQDYGDDTDAWKALAGGAAPGSITARATHAAWVVGIPIYGRRVVVVLDHSVSTDDPHPFGERERLQALCKVPGARDVPWFNLRTIGQFLGAHAKRLVADLPEGTQVALVTVGGPKLGLGLARLNPATPGAKAAVQKEIDAQRPANGLDPLGALGAALDAGGKEPADWANGPDEIVYLGCGVPWLAPVTDGLAIGEAIGLRARLRGVTIHTVGVGNHPEEMLRRIAELSGGRYLPLHR